MRFRLAKLRSLPTTLRQYRFLKKQGNGVERAILFMVPAKDIVTGGILSIVSQCQETRHLRELHNAAVLLCTPPFASPLFRFTRFANTEILVPLSMALWFFRESQSLTIHIPENSINSFLSQLTPTAKKRLSQIPKVHVNVMLQNIDHIQGQDIDGLRGLGLVTCTTAHEQYCSLATRERLGIPVHKLSVYVSPERYDIKRFREKEDIVVVSPDHQVLKESILAHIRRSCPSLRLVIVADMKYEDYLRLIGRAKWALTFGEGFDAYFVETVFSGGISFAVYNERFFTPAFHGLRTVYESYEDLGRRVVEDIRSLDNEKDYDEYSQSEYAKCSVMYQYSRYIDNIKAFLRDEWTFP